MTRAKWLGSALAAAALAVGCGDPQTDVAGPRGAGPAFAQTQVDSTSRANSVWADTVLVNGIWLPAGIRGDGRLKNGSPATGTPSNEFQGAACGAAPGSSKVGRRP